MIWQINSNDLVIPSYWWITKRYEKNHWSTNNGKVMTRKSQSQRGIPGWWLLVERPGGQTTRVMADPYSCKPLPNSQEISVELHQTWGFINADLSMQQHPGRKIPKLYVWEAIMCLCYSSSFRITVSNINWLPSWFMINHDWPCVQQNKSYRQSDGRSLAHYYGSIFNQPLTHIV